LPLTSALTTDVAFTADGSVWVNYQNPAGLTRLVKHGARYEAHEAEGLFTRTVYAMCTDRHGHLWIGTDRGAGMLDGNRWRQYDTSDGLVWNDINAGALLHDPLDGTLPSAGNGAAGARAQSGLAGGGGGVGAFDRLHSARHGPSQDNTLALTVGAPTFLHPESVRIFYRLAGDGEPWRMTANRDLLFARLPVGDYEFEAVAGTESGRGKHPPARLRFRILAAWWQTGWARMAAVSVLLGLMLAAARYRVRSLERAVRQRTGRTGRGKGDC
jgi:hypothetical protein